MLQQLDLLVHSDFHQVVELRIINGTFQTVGLHGYLKIGLELQIYPKPVA